MMLIRSHAAELELRSDGRTVYGLAVPYDSPAEVRDQGRTFMESFTRGSFNGLDAGAKFFANHAHKSDPAALPIGRATSLTEDAKGLFGEFHVSATTAGDEVLELIRDGALDGLSVGFMPSADDQWTQTRDAVVRMGARLVEVSAVSFAAYPGAVIQGVRSETFGGMPAREQAIRIRHRLRAI